MQNRIAKTETFGEFNEALPATQEYLRIQFSPSSLSLQQRWRNNGLSADFMADYLITFCPKGEPTAGMATKQSEIKTAISFIANELLENAMKFSDESSHYPTTITLHLLCDRLIFLATNSISVSSQERFRTFIQQLMTSDLNELYIRQLEAGVEDDPTTSGLGILTMMIDYLARMGWKFETFECDREFILVNTMVQIAM